MKRDRYNKVRLKLLQDKITKCGHKFNNPTNFNMKNIKTDSWFDIKEAKQPAQKIDISNTDNIDHDGFYTKKIIIYPNKDQKSVLLKWMDCYIKMYNATTKYFKKCKFNKEYINFSVTELKKILKTEKDTIVENSVIEVNINNKKKKVKVDKHLLDYAINDSLNRYKSCLTNLKNKNIKYFRLRYLKHTKNNKIIKAEKLAFRDNGFYVSSLGDKMECNIDKFKYLPNIKTVSIIKYDKKKDQFMLLIKGEKIDNSEEPKYKNKIEKVAIDLGIRVLMTCYGSDKITEIGTEDIVNKFIKNKLLQIDSINSNKNLSEKKRNETINKRYNKLKNKIEDMHWKIIDYLTKSYSVIVIGNFSTKSMGESNTVSDITKRIGNMYSIYKLKMKLKYKCKYTNTKYLEVNEAYTSKCCSKCTNVKDDLGSNKIYECKRCKQIIGRDINGAKNIMIISQ